MPGRRAAIAVCVFGLVFTTLRTPAHADIDRVVELAKLLSSSTSEKARISAAASLGKLGDKRAVKPLVDALKDPDPQVRAMAAASLGKLGHKASLPALRNAAREDADEDVRTIAHEAATKVAKDNQLPDELAPVDDHVAAAHGGRAGFGHQAHAVEVHPDLYVVINSSADDSPGKTDKKTRKAHGDIVRQVLLDQCKSAPLVTTVATDAQRWGLDARHVDLSVVKLEAAPAGNFVEIDAELRLAISDDRGKMLSILSGGAKVQVPRKTYDAKYLPVLRKEALENAMRGMFEKLIAHLRDRSLT